MTTQIDWRWFFPIELSANIHYQNIYNHRIIFFILQQFFELINDQPTRISTTFTTLVILYGSRTWSQHALVGTFFGTLFLFVVSRKTGFGEQ